MPERVRTVFDDDGHSVTVSSKQHIASGSSHVAIHGKKRKRNDRSDGVPSNEGRNKPRTEVSQLARVRTEQVNGQQKQAENGPQRVDGQSNGLHTADGGHSQGRLSQLQQKRHALLRVREALPIWSHAHEIRQCLRGSKDVMLLVGETGSGKSTQVPQFLLNEPWCKGRIAITQPRRVAAISLARRVAEEMGTPLGSSSPASKVGYSVRFDNSASPSTRIKFLTEGMLLQEMLRDPWMQEYSAVIVDEVHERSVNVDLVLGFLRRLVTRDKKGRKGKPLKVVVMSATADTESLLKFFHNGYQEAAIRPDSSSGNGTLTDVAQDSEASWSGISSSEDGEPPKKPSRPQTNGHTPTTISKAVTKPSSKNQAITSLPKVNQNTSEHVSTCYIEGRQYPVKIMYLPDPTQDFVEAALKCIFQIHVKEPHKASEPGDILVFLTGQDTVEALERLVNEYAQGLGPELPKILALPLFAALPQSAQQRIFQRAPPKTRKVILSTNIAETSVTVPGVRFVIDSGKVKIKQFRNRLGLDSLLVKPISQSSAIQRKGRAGREAPGQCYRLYTEQDYLKLEPSTTPEILRCDLSSALLTMKARGVDDVLNFPFLDRPPREALEKALLQLLQLGALDEMGNISEMGARIAKLPLTPMLGRVIIEAAEPSRDCLVDIVDIIACLSVENIFLNLVTEEKKEEAEVARRELYRREGDHLTLLATVQAYAAEQTDRKAWAEKHFVSHRAMQNVMDVRKQLLAQCKQLKLLPESASLTSDATSQPSKPSEARNNAILQSLVRGFAANTARLMPDGSYKTLIGNQTVAIHPSSVLFGKKVEAIVFSEFVFTNKSYARGVGAVRLDWVGEVIAGSA